MVPPVSFSLTRFSKNCFAVTIQSSGGLTPSEIERMVKDAEANAEKDKARKELSESKNQAESLINSAESNLHEYKDKLPADGSHFPLRLFHGTPDVLSFEQSLIQLKPRLRRLVRL